MPEKIATTGDEGLDRELDSLRLLVTTLTQRVSALEISGASTVAAAASVPLPAALLGVGLLAGNPVGTTTIYFDAAAGYKVTPSGALATIGRTASVSVPAAVSSAGAAGTSAASANADHVHAGVRSLNGLLGNIVLQGNGGITITAVGNILKISAPMTPAP